VGEMLLADFLRTSVYSTHLAEQVVAEATISGIGTAHAGRAAHSPHLLSSSSPVRDLWREAASVWAADKEDVAIPHVFGQLVVRPSRKARCSGAAPRQGQQLPSCSTIPGAALSAADAHPLALQSAEGPAELGPSGCGAIWARCPPLLPCALHVALEAPLLQHDVGAACASHQHRGAGGSRDAGREEDLYAALLQSLPLQCLHSGGSAAETDELPGSTMGAVPGTCAAASDSGNCGNTCEGSELSAGRPQGELESPLLLHSLLSPL
jgi:hypothetical protein